jgi:hypothetical protein
VLPPGTAVKLLWPAVNPALARKIWRFKAFIACPNRHWPEPKPALARAEAGTTKIFPEIRHPFHLLTFDDVARPACVLLWRPQPPHAGVAVSRAPTDASKPA